MLSTEIRKKEKTRKRLLISNVFLSWAESVKPSNFQINYGAHFTSQTQRWQNPLETIWNNRPKVVAKLLVRSIVIKNGNIV